MVSPREVAAAVVDPELPMLTIADLGMLRDVTVRDGRVVVSITPTYSGCPAFEAIRAELRRRLAEAGFPDAEIRTVLSPPWSTDWISDAGRRALAEHGVAPPGEPDCPVCGSHHTRERSRFGSTPCKALRGCTACGEPFENVKEF